MHWRLHNHVCRTLWQMEKSLYQQWVQEQRLSLQKHRFLHQKKAAFSQSPPHLITTSLLPSHTRHLRVDLSEQKYFRHCLQLPEKMWIITSQTPCTDEGPVSNFWELAPPFSFVWKHSSKKTFIKSENAYRVYQNKGHRKIHYLLIQMRFCSQFPYISDVLESCLLGSYGVRGTEILHVKNYATVYVNKRWSRGRNTVKSSSTF